ncbi:hypothetical protein DL93DRAFT_2227726 [Clavulina sp. PMI_390]|nr:hypothetical protein DL93DRAFT_2227726 [Clavulina sp. PMI_390]
MATQFRDLTRTCVLNGVSAPKWESLVQELKKRNPSISDDEVGSQVWAALRPLFATHPAEKNLPQYVPTAVLSGIISLRVLTIGLLTQPFVGSSTSSLSELSLLDQLVQHVISALMSRGPPPYILLPTPSEGTLEDVLNAIHSGIHLVKFVANLRTQALAHHPALSATLSMHTLLLLLYALNSVPGLDALSLNDATDLQAHLAEIAVVLASSVEESSSTAQRIGEWSHQISFHVYRLQGAQSDAPTSTRLSQAAVIYNSRAPGSFQDVALPEGSELACSVTIQRLVNVNPGAGSSVSATGDLLALYRSFDMNSAVFVRSLLLTAVHLVSLSRQGERHQAFSKMAAFTIARLPRLLKYVEEIAHQPSPSDDLRTAVSSSLSFVVGDPNLVAACSGRSPEGNATTDGTKELRREDLVFAHHLVHCFAKAELVKDEHVTLASIAPHFPTDRFELDKVRASALDDGVTLEEWFLAKLDSGAFQPDSELVNELLSSYSSHAAFANFAYDSVQAACSEGKLALLAALSRALYLNSDLLDVVCLHIPIAKLIRRMVGFMTGFDFFSANDAQSSLVEFGDLIFFAQVCTLRFKLPVDVAAIQIPSRVSTPLSCLSADDIITTQKWIHSIFSPASEGIDDELQRHTEPLALLRLAPTILVEGFNNQTSDNVHDVLLGGLDYYLSEILRWTLPSVLLALVASIEREGPGAGIRLEALHKLVTSPNCPAPAVQIAGPSILRLLRLPFIEESSITDVKRLCMEIIGAVNTLLNAPSDTGSSSAAPSKSTHADYPRALVHSLLIPKAVPSPLPFGRLSSCAPSAILGALHQQLIPLMLADGRGGVSISKPTTILSAAIVNARPQPPYLLSHLLQEFVPHTLSRIGTLPLPPIPDNITPLVFLIGVSVSSLHSTIQAREAAAAYFERNGSLDSPASEVAKFSQQLDDLIKNFIRWLEVPKVETSSLRSILLQRLRARSEFGSHFGATI